MKIIEETKLDFDDVLLVPSRSNTASRRDVELSRGFKFFHSTKDWNGTPIMASNMDSTGTIKMAEAFNSSKMITCLHKHYKAEHIVDFFKNNNMSSYAWVSIGMNDDELNKLDYINGQLNYTPNICIDIANGYTEKFVGWCYKIRERYGDSPIVMAGNVATPDMVQELILHGGVDIVKIGVGPGSACTTRLKTGVGYPQLSAIMECSHAAHGLKSAEKRMGLICADGGCRYPGDVCKAFAGNADFVMLGGMFAGTDECEGEWEYYDSIPSKNTLVPRKKKNMIFYGMSSAKAQEKYSGGLDSYKASEGRIKRIPHKGPVKLVLKDILGGLRSCCAYVGATRLKDLPKCANAVKVNKIHFDKTV